MRFFCLAALWMAAALGAVQPPELIRIYPLGGQAGSTISLEILGRRLSNVTGVEFDSRDLVWQRTTQSGAGKVTGDVLIAPGAALGAHMLRVITLDGPSTSAIFNVGQFASIPEKEPNDVVSRAQRIEALPAEVQGRLDGAPDIDIFSFNAKSGDRWVFDLKSIENGSAVEARMILMDAAANRIAFNDDRDDYNENPWLEHTFASAGSYSVKLDQYRGPRGFNFGKICSYTLRISAAPAIKSVFPLALPRGAQTTLRLTGSNLDSVEKVYLTGLRLAEYARMTYPYTMPIHFRPDPRTASEQVRLEGKVGRRGSDWIDILFPIPAAARSGLWKLWATGSRGAGEGLSINIVDGAVISEASAAALVLGSVPVTINGALNRPQEKDVYRVQARAGQPLHFWTVAAQLGVPFLDSVLTLRDASGRKLAENDDVVAGQGTLVGNPDSSLFYTPKQDGPLTIEVHDRTRRGGPGFEYCLKFEAERPGFQLFTTPENFTVAQDDSAEIKVHLIREDGFEGEVDIWFEGLPAGVQAIRGRFRADQLFEPNADGADMIIPDIAFRIQIPKSVQPGTYPIRVYGSRKQDDRIVEAHATFMMGPLLDAWNFVRRPVPAITMSVVQPFAAALHTDIRTLKLDRGKTATIELKAENVPDDARFRVLDLPDGVQYRVLGRQGSQVTIGLEATPQAALGTFEITAETNIGTRRAPSTPIALSIQVAVPGN